MKEKYKLLKDLPDLNAGAIFTWDEEKNVFISEKRIWVSPYREHTFTAGTVTQTPEWFEKIPESKIHLTKQNLEALLVACLPSYYTRSWIIGKIDEYLSKMPKETVLNEMKYSAKDMLDFARFIHGTDSIYEINVQHSVPIDMLLLDKWIQKAHPEDCVKPRK